jgi:hypothetical protein
MGPEGSVPPSNGIPLVDVYGGPRYGLECPGTVGLGLRRRRAYSVQGRR